MVGLAGANNGITSAMMNYWHGMDLDDVQADFLLMGKNSYEREPTCSFLKQVKEAGGRIYRIPYDWTKVSAASRKKFFDLIRYRHDLAGIHVHSVGIYGNSCFNYSAFRAHKPVNVIHVHSGAAMKDVRPPGRGCVQQLSMLKRAGATCLGCSDNALAASYADRVDSQFYPNAVDLRRFRFDPVLRMAARRAMGLADDDVAFLILGTMYHVKNPVYALKVFSAFHRKYPKSHIYFVGGGRDDDLLEQMSKLYRVRKHLHIMGDRQDAELFYNACDVFLMPSKHEGFPNVLVEAQACGIPCMVSDVITSAVAMTDLVHFHSIEDQPYKWARAAEEILAAHSPRRPYTQEVRDAGFDRLDAGRRLTEMYREMIDRARAEGRRW